MTKNEIRKNILARRLGLSDSEASLKSRVICQRLVSDDLFISASVIGLYWPFKKEVLTQSIFRAALSGHKNVGFPLVSTEERRIIYIAVNDPSELSAGTYGVMEPPRIVERIIPHGELDLIVVPGVVFDERGYRIGYGGGYFDRLLTEDTIRAASAAVAFDIQIIDQIPREDHDRKVDVIFTESRIIRCS